MNLKNDYLHLKDVSKKYKNNIIFKNVSCRLLRCHKTSILGENGVGKTTLLKLLLGFIKPDLGSVNSAYFEMGFVPHHISLLGDSYVYELIEYFRHFEKSEKSRFNDFLIQRFGISNLFDKQIRTLSYGQAKRVQFFTSLFNCPDFLLMDEPMNGLDFRQKMAISETLDEVSEKVGLIFTAHDLDFIERFSDKSYIIKNQQLVEVETSNVHNLMGVNDC